MITPLPPLENTWAVDALVLSHNHIYHAAYKSRYEELGGVGVSYYGQKVPASPYQMEFMAFDPDPVVVIARINSYPKKPGDRYVLNVFHAEPSDLNIKAQYLDLGYEFVETAMIMGLPLPVKTPRGWTHVHKIDSLEEIEFVNRGLESTEEHIPPHIFGDPHIINFYAQLEHRAVGWTQLVTAYAGVGYINQLYTLPVYRQRGIGTRMLRHVHQEANHLGLHHMVLLASEMGMSLFIYAGYQPLAYLSVFRPRTEAEG
jgi:GNAT superfamily N-acetyltransferase